MDLTTLSKTITVRYSDEGLRFWEAGCTWIEEGKGVIQLRAALQHKERYLGIISKKEILAHEKIHALRASLEEPRFEEVLAYHTSTSSFRRYWGPFFRSPRESLLYILTMAVVPFGWPFALFFALITLLGCIRLVRTQRVFRRALAKRGFEALLFSTDKEIEAATRT